MLQRFLSGRVFYGWYIVYAIGFGLMATSGLAFYNLSVLLNAFVTERDVFASELVIRAGIMNRKVVEIPIALHEKRKPTINLYKRVPKVLRNLGTLFVEIRITNRNREG